MRNNNNSKWAITTAIFVYIMIIIGIKYLWWSAIAPIHTIPVSDGEADIRDVAFNTDSVYHLDGDWEFYPNKLIGPEELQEEDKQFIQVPFNWKDSLANDKKTTEGVGTYRLKITLPEKFDADIGFYFMDVYTSAKVFMDGELIKSAGRPSIEKGLYKGNIEPFDIIYRPKSNTVDLVVQVANHELPNYGGILKSVKFGSESAINTYVNEFEMIQIVMIILFLLHVTYGIVLFMIGNRGLPMVYFILIALAAATATLFEDSYLGLRFFDLTLEGAIKTKIISYTLIPIYVLFTLRRLYPDEFKTKSMNILLLLNILLVIVEIVIPLSLSIYTLFMSSFLSIFTFLMILYINISNRFFDQKYYKILVFLNLCLISGTVSSIIFTISNVRVEYYPFETIFVFMGLTILLFQYTLSETEKIKSLSNNLKQVNELKTLFVTSISKELRSPIQSIINVSNYMTENKMEKTDLELITLAGRHMSITLNNLVDISEIYEKEIYLHKQSINIASLVRSVIPIFTFQKADNIKIKTNIPAHFPAIYADENRMIQITFILIQNALQYMDAGTITIEAEEKNGKAFISVKDTGVGITEEYLADIFNPYINDPKSFGVRHTGVDLFICQQLVHLHGGSIEAKSEHNIGSVFTFTIPLDREQKRKQSSMLNEQEKVLSHKEGLIPIQEIETENKEETNGAHVLLVDYDRLHAEVMQRLLMKNYQVTVTNNSAEAMEKIDANTFDIVIAEIMLPGTSGLELIKEVRKKYTSYELPIILTATKSLADEKYTAFSAGANDFILKPIDITEMQSRVHSFVMLRKSVEERLDMEAAWLQAQIRPHFLFNTLGTIISLSYTDQEAMVKLLNDFSQYLRMSFRTTNTDILVPLGEELDLVYAYLEIGKSRFGERINVMMAIEESKPLFIPPLALQTIVENAIRHGILGKVDGGTLFISLEEKEDHAALMIKDNGNGMNEERVQNLLSGNAEGRTGIGISNTNARLKRLFGKGLDIRSEIGEGTEITIYLPYQD